MKWHDAYILLMDAEDDTLRKFSDALKIRYAIPSGNSYANVSTSGYTNFESGFLKRATLDSKIIVVSHGRESQVMSVVGGIQGGYLAHRFANFLAIRMGLKECGLISFKGCNIGLSRYVDDFSFVLGEQFGVRHGWVIGYRGGAAVVHDSLVGVGIFDTLIRGNAFFPKLSDSSRVKVVRGNVSVTPPLKESARYPR
ncbi:hypothetical protein KNO81_41915 [Paraburkholderia sediminicola]|jgi:hypothetical protein|nr:hypothetical protein [Paraburkholderia sediminicola]